MSQLKKRSEMDPKWMWNLNDILNGTEAFNALFEEAEKAIVRYPNDFGVIMAAGTLGVMIII